MPPSSYEAAEAGTIYAIRLIGAFREDYGLIEIRPTVPEWVSISKETRAAQSALKAGRSKEASRRDDYDALMAHFRTLVPRCETITAARDEMNKRLEARRTQTIRWYCGTVIALSAVVVTLIVAIFW